MLMGNASAEATTALPVWCAGASWPIRSAHYDVPEVRYKGVLLYRLARRFVFFFVFVPPRRARRGDDVLVLLVSMASIDSARDFYRMQYRGS